MTAPDRPRASGAALVPSRATALETFGRWVAAKGWVHVLLLTGLAICVYPPVWMFLTSVKTDEELARDEILPALPLFREFSPYVRDHALVVRPADVAVSRLDNILPVLRLLTAAMSTANVP